MNRFASRSGAFDGTFLKNLFAELEPLIVQVLSALLLKALPASSSTSGTVGGSGGAASGTGSPLTTAEHHLLSLMAQFQEYALSPEGAVALAAQQPKPGTAPKDSDA